MRLRPYTRSSSSIAPPVMKITSADTEAIIGSIDSVAYMYMRTGSVTVCGEVTKIDMVNSSKLLMKASSQPPVMPGRIIGKVMRRNVVHANLIHHVATRMSDTAGIYALSAQAETTISENDVHSITMSPYVHDPEHWFYLYADEGSSFSTWKDNWCPEKKFLQNANGPGNVWENNGPEVDAKIKAAAGLEPAFRDLLK